MPYCELSGNGIRLFYRRYGHGSTKVLCIIGLAGTHDSWRPQIKGLIGDLKPREEEEEEAASPGAEEAGGRRSDVADQKRQEEEEEGGIEVCCFDNRGAGRSSVPTTKSDYTWSIIPTSNALLEQKKLKCRTTIMAKDALALLDHLGWEKAHVFGHSMGAMIACKLAAMAPERICSLALLSVTGGGYECFPKIDLQTLSLAFRFLRAKTPEERASVDLETHYTKEYLDQYVGSCKRRNILYQEYVKTLSSKGMQSAIGFEGQSNACWTHSLTSNELRTIHTSGFLVSVIHGRCDIIAQLEHARRLAEKLHPVAKMVELRGGHLVNHERPDEINGALMDLIKASKLKLKPEEWSSFAVKQSGWLVVGEQMPLAKRNNHGVSPLLIMFNLLGKLPLSCIYFFGSFIMACENMKNSFNILKPVRVAALDS
ncbi:hypothetical protein ZIOFF_029245 [Zingiber officinale]|uniref:AB hydrolase-1 domain-containing protein n=1 Tax=Zingiber officinale TaxID=94328 RepID=A0A8J5GP94_ZINOF|nr:hypothetical protein ZIOFF_029245 [Zingiber officinale]